MKKIVLGAMLLAGTALVAFQPVAQQEKVVLGKICFKIKNDTGKSQTLHTGSGTTSINNLTTNEICIEEGGSLYLADKGNKGKVLLKVTSSVSGKTFELSKLLR